MSYLEKSGMYETQELPSNEEQEYFHKLGLETDPLGRPLHPWREQLPELEEGRGFYWRWGPNYTVDPIVISMEDEPKLLLIRRNDNGMLALPGGFVDQGEPVDIAGRRELLEETTLILDNTEPVLCYKGPVLDQRSRLHAWSETTALLWHSQEAQKVCAGDDAVDVTWMPLSKVRQLTGLHGSHATLIDMAIREHGSLHEQLEYFGEQCELSEPRGGHMGYARIIASTPHGKRIFIKRHDDQKFTDPTRADHSKRYLHKEHYVYGQLAGKIPHIPAHVELHKDHTLLMEAYDKREGWFWKAPTDIDTQRQYIQDVMNALQSFQHLEYDPYTDIKESYQTLIDEGWSGYTHHRTAIIHKLETSNIAGAHDLANDLDNLYEQYKVLTPPELTHFAHYDIRQSNIAWHPEFGVRIVDWSWADRAPARLDTTSFLVDLAKAGHDITEFIEHTDRNHLLVLIGFWLEHSSWPTPTADQTVREHQIGSAIAAYRLLKRLSE